MTDRYKSVKLAPGVTLREIPNPTKPSIALLCKLGSIIVHADEGSSGSGHEFDWVAMRGVLEDQEVQDWLLAMTGGGYLPVKRSN